MIRFAKQPGLVVYVTCGDPDMQTTHEVVLAAIDAGADVIELGVPFSDPLADGPVIQRASERALRQGTNLADVLKLAGDIRRLRPQAGLIIFSYLNPVYRYGIQKFAEDAKAAGIDGALLTDMTVEESGEYRRFMVQAGLATVFLAAPTSPDERLKKIAAASSGFIYAVSRTGVTGAQQSVSEDAAKLVKRIRKFSRLPVALGFGISTAEQFTAVGKFADAVVVGSAIVKLVEDAGSAVDAAQRVGEFVRGLLKVKS